jgi:hypothetical protein
MTAELHELPIIPALPRDIKLASATLGRDEARFLVDTYYNMQDMRKALHNQERALNEGDEPHGTVTHFASQFLLLEKYIAGALDAYGAGQPLGRWARAQVGIGPVIAAGLLAHIDISKVNTAGQIWRYAGLDPTSKWGKGEKRPWNADLKVLCWKIGDSFVKTSGRDNAFYGQLYRQRKAYEIERNEAVVEFTHEVQSPVPMEQAVHIDSPNARWFYGGNAKCAAETLAERKIKDPETRKVYESGKLPAGRLDLRARRWAVKIFLAHYFEEGYRQMHKQEPPLPYAIAHLNHAHRIEAPAA